MVVFGLIGGVLVLLLIATMLDSKEIVKEQKESFIINRSYPIKKKIKTYNPLIGDIVLYDFKRDSVGMIDESDVLSSLYKLKIVGTDTEGKNGYLEYGIDEETMELYFKLGTLSDSDMLDLMTTTTNINFNSFRFKDNKSAMILFGKDTPIVKEIIKHVQDLIEEAFTHYVGEVELLMANEEVE